MNNYLRTSSFVGTYHAMAPEILSEDPSYSYEVDYYSLGILAYELLNGYASISSIINY